MNAAAFQAVQERVELDVASGLVLSQPEEDRKALVGEVVRLRQLPAARYRAALESLVSELSAPPVDRLRAWKIVREALR